MEDPTKTVMDELARTSGVVGVERLAALFIKREPDAAKTMSKTEVRRMANEVLRVKPDKQILAYPKERSGGAIHASAPDEVWQIDLADMRGFNVKGQIHTLRTSSSPWMSSPARRTRFPCARRPRRRA